MAGRFGSLGAAVLVALVWASAGHAAATGSTSATETSASLADLLARVREAGEEDRIRFEQRVAEFLADPDQRQARLEEAEARRAEREKQSAELSATYGSNEIEINELSERLSKRMAELGLAELFGIARQVAGDSATVLDQSLVSTEGGRPGTPQRSDFLRRLADSRGALTTADVERLWMELHREITASGQVIRFPASVVSPTGETASAEVTRIGTFTATADGEFLTYLPTLQTLLVLPRQLPESLMETAGGFERASSGYAPAVVDPSRGVLLSLYAERPTVVERIQLGEAVGYVIIFVGVLGLIAFLYQLVHLVVIRIRMGRQLREPDQPKTDNPLGRVLLSFKGDAERIEETSEAVELRVTEAVMREVPKLERFQAFLRLAVAAGPLLGLIGTVVGMIITFQSITEAGSSDPRLMATGIGQAMIATVLGLGIAIPLLFANALLNTLSRGAVQVLEGESVGILAESIERRQRG